MELSLVNYQAWEKAHLNIEGLTVVVGPSNRGKSSFGRALRGAFRNDVLPAHIRIGSPGVKVRVGYDALDILVTRGAKTKDSTIYQVGDEKFEKLGGDVPQVIKDQHFGPVDISGTKIDPIFAGQFDAQFLLGSSPAELNLVLNAFAATERLDRGRKVLASRVVETNATAKALTPQISGMEEQSASLESTLATAVPAQDAIRSTHAQVIRLQATLDALELLQRSRQAQSSLAAQQAALTRLEQELGTAIRLYKGAARVAATQTAKQIIETTTRQTMALQQVEQAAPVAVQTNKALAAAVVLQTTHTRQQANTQRLDALATVAEALMAPLRHYKALVRVKAVIQTDPTDTKALAAQIVALDTSRPERTLAAGIILQTLQGLLAGAETTRTSLDSLGLDSAALAQEIDTITAQIEMARQAGTVVTCPKCHHEFTPDHSH